MKHFGYMHPADQLVTFMQRIYQRGLTTTSGGNLSVLDDNGDVWITPSGIDKGSLTRRDIMRVLPDGKTEGIHTPSVELPFHKKIYEKRPDIKAIIHAHSPALIAFSLVRRVPDTRFTPDIHFTCGKVGMAAYAVPGSRELGDNIAEKFGEGCDMVLLENHGVVVGSVDLSHAYAMFEALEFAARTEIEAGKLSRPVELTKEQLDMAKWEQADLSAAPQKTISSEERDARRNICAFTHRAYDQFLFTCTQGTFSQRLTDGAFLTAPPSADRKYMEEADIMHIGKSPAESGGSQNYFIKFIQAVYQKHPDIQSVVIARSPNIMAFAITHNELETKTIPESYLQLRNIRKIPFEAIVKHPEETAEIFCSKVPIALVENNCILVTGDSLLNAYDRLEVAEYSARAILSAKTLGNLVPINDQQVHDIEVAFHMK